MNLSIIVAMDNNRLIGNGYALPWRLSSDLKNFKAITMGKPIVMGRKTRETIGSPLPGRENVIVTRDTNYTAKGCTVLNSLECVRARFRYEKEVMIMGGAELYRQTLDGAGRIYLTEVHAECAGDIYFPEWDRSKWQEIARQDHKADDRNEFDYSFVTLERLVKS